MRDFIERIFDGLFALFWIVTVICDVVLVILTAFMVLAIIGFIILAIGG